MTEPQAWRDRARCRDFPDVNFFPDPGRNVASAAKAICNRCPVRRECLDHALANPSEQGVWGGLSQKERRWIRQGKMPNPQWAA